MAFLFQNELLFVEARAYYARPIQCASCLRPPMRGLRYQMKQVKRLLVQTRVLLKNYPRLRLFESASLPDEFEDLIPDFLHSCLIGRFNIQA